MDVEDALDWELLHGGSRAGLVDLLLLRRVRVPHHVKPVGATNVGELLLPRSTPQTRLRSVLSAASSLAFKVLPPARRFPTSFLGSAETRVDVSANTSSGNTVKLGAGLGVFILRQGFSPCSRVRIISKLL